MNRWCGHNSRFYAERFQLTQKRGQFCYNSLFWIFYYKELKKFFMNEYSSVVQKRKFNWMDALLLAYEDLLASNWLPSFLFTSLLFAPFTHLFRYCFGLVIVDTFSLCQIRVQEAPERYFFYLCFTPFWWCLSSLCNITFWWFSFFYTNFGC